MPIYRRVFVSTDVALVHELFLANLAAARELGRKRNILGLAALSGRVLALEKAHRDFNSRLRAIQLQTSVNATAQIVRQLSLTQKRGDTGIRPHLRDKIVSRAIGPVGGLQTGAVGVADEELLDSGRTAAYWRTQEFGSGSDEVKSLIGNRLQGYFYKTGFAGFPSPPSQAENRRHPVFRAGPPIGGQQVPFGIGIVQHEIQARHFIRDGSTAAAVQWRREMNLLQLNTIIELRRLPP